MRKVDVAIIGAGSAGLAARRQIAKQTDNYVVIDGGILGTTCARVGCMPSKVLIQAATDYYRRLKFEEQGIHNGAALAIEHRLVMKHVRKLRDRFVRGVDSGMQSWMNEKTFIGRFAHFIDEFHLQVGDEVIEAQKIVIATGSTPIIPKELQEFKEHLITTDQFFELETLPEKMAVIGTGVIGLELGQALHRLGVETTLIARRNSLAGITDPVLLEYCLRKLSEELSIKTCGIKAVVRSRSGLVLNCGSDEVEVNKVLLAAGRAINLASLKLKSILPHWDGGRLDYDPHNFSLKQFNHIFLAGDNLGEKQILHEASDEGNIVGHNIFKKDPTLFVRRTPLAITFSDPNIALIGESYEELERRKANIAIGENLFEGQGRSIVKLKEVGMIRIYGEKETGKLLGAELFAPEGEHLAHLLAWCIQMDLTVNQVLAMPFYHPVIEEGMRTALRNLRDQVDEKIWEIELRKINEGRA